MSPRTLMWIMVTICSIVASYIPLLWGESAFGMTSLFFGTVGGFGGLWLSFKILGY
jgi:hypothetical protein